MSDAAHWKQFNENILKSLDLILEYQSLGVHFTKTSPSASGTCPCYGILRGPENPDKNASAYVNLNNGRYTDKPNGDSLSFWDFCVACGKFPTWEDARKHYAAKSGLAKNLPKKEHFGHRPQDKVKPISGSIPAHWFSHFTKQYTGTTSEGIALSGGRVGKYPFKSSDPRYVIYWYAYGPGGTEHDPTAVAVMPLDGGHLSIFQGAGAPPRLERKVVFSGSGLIGSHALKHWEEAEVIYKVEGLTDLIALQSIIPDDKLNKHLVITNACGAGEYQVVTDCAALFKGKNVIIVHDADKPGQAGAEIWLKTLASHTASIKNIALPFEITDKKGKDLRDFINLHSGNYQEIEKLCLGFTSIGPDDETLQVIPSVDQSMLKQMGIEVIGELEDASRYNNRIYIFSQELGKRSEIPQISKITRADLIQKVGPHIREYVKHGNDDVAPGKVHLWQVKEAIAAIASTTPLKVEQTIGPGCWEVDGKIYLVGNRDVAIWDGDSLQLSKSIHSIGGKLVEHSHESWYSFKQLNEFVKESDSQEWCTSAIEESNALFRKWGNWKHYRNAEITTALVAVSWLQTVWKWRPVVAVTGPSNCGKSTLLAECLPPMFGALSLDFECRVTEAAVRNLLQCSAMILILDEFEKTKDRDRIVQEIFRTTTRGGRSGRGTADQRGKIFGLRHIPWTGAIKIKMDDAADRSRYVILEMESVPVGQASSLCLPSTQELHRLGLKLLAVSLRHWKRIIALQQWLKQQPIEGYYQRIVESYGLIAGLFGAVYGLDEQGTMEVLLDYLKHRDFADQSEFQFQEFFRGMVTQEVMLPRGERAIVAELLRSPLNGSDFEAAKVLERIGIKRLRKAGGTELFFSHELIAKNLMRGDTQGSDVRQVFKHCSDAIESKQRISQHNARGFRMTEAKFWELVGESAGDAPEDALQGNGIASPGANGKVF